MRGNVVTAAKLCSDFNDMHVSGFIPTGPPNRNNKQLILLIIIALLEEWPQSGPQPLRWIETDQSRGSPSTSSQSTCLAHVAHMLELAVTDPDNPDYPGIPDGAEGGA